MRPVPTLALIRPEAASRALANRIEAAIGHKIPTLIAPVITVAPVPATYDPAPYAGLILTSANAVAFADGLAGRPVWCVGTRTAQAARARGAIVQAQAPDAQALVDLILAKPPEGKLLWLRGTHVASDVAGNLATQGIETDAVVVYDQPAPPPDPALLDALTGNAPVILPLYSPRSARLIGQAITHPGPGVTAIALSPKIARTWQAATGQACGICSRPKGDEMERRIIAALRQSTA